MIDDNLCAAVHVAAAALGREFAGVAPAVLAMLLCGRLMAVGPQESALPRGWSAIEFGEHASRVSGGLAMHVDPIWKVLAAQTCLVLAQAYAFAGRVQEALRAISSAMIYGFQVEDSRVIAEAVVVAEPIVTLHGRRDTAAVLLGYLEQFRDQQLAPHMTVQLLLAHANVLRMLARIDDAADHCDRALAAIAADPDEVSLLLRVKALTTAALLARDRGDSAAGLRHALALVELHQRPQAATDIPPLTQILNLHTAADAAVTEGSLDTAAQLLARARDQVADTGFGDSALIAADLAAVSARLATRQGKLKVARTEFESAITLLESMGEGFRPRLPAVLVGLGDVLYAQNHPHDAGALVERALAIDERNLSCRSS